MNAIERDIRVQIVNYIRALKRQQRIYITVDLALQERWYRYFVSTCKQMFRTYGHLLTNSQYEECFNILYGEQCNT